MNPCGPVTPAIYSTIAICPTIAIKMQEMVQAIVHAILGVTGPLTLNARKETERRNLIGDITTES